MGPPAGIKPLGLTPAHWRAIEKDPVLRRVFALLALGASYAPTEEAAAAAAAVSVATLRRRFHDALPFSFRSAVTKIRADGAKVLLRTTRLKISIIARQVGYADVRGLRRLLQRVLKVTPGEWRRAGPRSLNE